MKKIAKALIFMMVVCFVASNTSAQIVVRVRPGHHAMVTARPAQPSPRHVWVDEEWVPQGRKYAWHGGYWAAPAHPGAVYVKGHWNHTRHGWVWIAGAWR